MTQNSVVTPFAFDTHQVRVVTLEGNPWFVAADVARVLTIKNITDTLKSSYIDTSERARFDLGAYAGNVVNLISESGLYKLIMRSDKPEAKRFQDWVTKEVLPSVRKTGAYVTGQPSISENPSIDTLDLLMAQAQLFPKLIERMKEQQRQIEEQGASLAAVQEAVRDQLDYLSVSDFLRTHKLLYKTPMGIRTALGKKASEATRSAGWIIKTKELGTAIYPKKAIYQAAASLRLI